MEVISRPWKRVMLDIVPNGRLLLLARPSAAAAGEAQLAADRRGTATSGGVTEALKRRIKCVRMGPASHDVRRRPSPHLTTDAPEPSRPAWPDSLLSIGRRVPLSPSDR